MKKKYRCIYNMRLAGFLMMNGIAIQRIETNLGRRWRNVFLFESSPDIELLIEDYKNQKNEGDIINVNIKNSKNNNCSSKQTIL